MDYFLPLVISTAAIDSINPCAISVLLLSIAFLASVKKERKAILLSGFIYILAVFVSYILIGVGILHVLTQFGEAKLIQKIGAALIVLIGLYAILTELFPKMPIKLQIPSFSKPLIGKVIFMGTYPAAFVLGVVVALVEFPCTGGPYLFILSMLQARETLISGLGYLIVYNIVFVLPLVAVLLFAGNKKVVAWFEARKSKNARAFRITLNVGLIVIGVLMFVLSFYAGGTCVAR
jgi:cytochrome c-type biogenesis protein